MPFWIICGVIINLYGKDRAHSEGNVRYTCRVRPVVMEWISRLCCILRTKHQCILICVVRPSVRLAGIYSLFLILGTQSKML